MISKIKTSGDLPNERGFSNVVNWNSANEFIKGVQDSINKNTGKKEDVVMQVTPPVSETKILGMHPMTLMIVTLGVLVVGITGVIIYKKSK